jgi:hypothetical protein
MIWKYVFFVKVNQKCFVVYVLYTIIDKNEIMQCFGVVSVTVCQFQSVEYGFGGVFFEEFVFWIFQ